jgi:hypothetical protein
MSSFFRPDFTLESINKIHERTEPGTFQLHIYDNGSDLQTTDMLYDLLKSKKITSVTLDSRNTGCLYNKLIYHAMTETDQKYYVVTDNDIFPPLLTPSWLTQMVGIMDRQPEINVLAPQLPPTWLQEPYEVYEDVVYCKAVGNTFKMVRREAIPVKELMSVQKIGVFGDDGHFSRVADGHFKDGKNLDYIDVNDKNKKVAFCKNIFCWHAGQCENWGYKPEEINKDPRKAGYGKPFLYEPINNLTYEPPAVMRL